MYPWLRTELTYTSNSLEGNILTLIETSLVINDNQSVGGKNLRDIYKVQNHARAWDFVQAELVVKKTKDLTEKDLLNLHALTLKKLTKQTLENIEICL